MKYSFIFVYKVGRRIYHTTIKANSPIEACTAFTTWGKEVDDEDLIAEKDRQERVVLSVITQIN